MSSCQLLVWRRKILLVGSGGICHHHETTIGEPTGAVGEVAEPIGAVQGGDVVDVDVAVVHGDRDGDLLEDEDAIQSVNGVDAVQGEEDGEAFEQKNARHSEEVEDEEVEEDVEEEVDGADQGEDDPGTEVGMLVCGEA